MKKAERLNQELIFLRDKSRFQLRDLMREFEISKRTALRDVEELTFLGLPIYTETGRNGGYRLISQKLLTPVTFAASEIEAIFFALHALEMLSTTPFERDYSQIREKLLATLPKSQQQTISDMLANVHYVQVPPVKENQPLALILRNILDERILELDYQQYAPEHLLLQIYELFYRDGIWFCSAWNVERQHWGTFRCDFMENCRQSPNQLGAQSLTELARLQQEYEANFHTIPFRCRLTERGKEHFWRHHYPNMRLDDDFLTGGYNPSELDYMLQYLLAYGAEMMIEAPIELKDSYLEFLQSLQAKY